MLLRRFSMSSRRGQPARELDLTRGQEVARVVVVTGEPGVGKTSVLEALALHKEHIAPYDRMPSARSFLGEAASHAYFEAQSEWRLTSEEKSETASSSDLLTGLSIFRQGRGEVHADPALVHLLARFKRDPQVSKVDMFGEAWLGLKRGAPLGEIERWHRVHRLGFGPEKHAGLVQLYQAASQEQRDAVAALVERLLPGLRPSGPDLTFSTRFGARLLNELSMTERLAFELAATFVLIGHQQSVVVLDGFDRAFPRRAGHVLRGLRSFAPNAQLLVVSEASEVLDQADTVVAIRAAAE